MAAKEIKKIILAYSGGLDTSIIIPWLKENYPGSEIVGVCTNVGQDEDWENMEKKALNAGASKLYIKDIRREFVADYVFPMLRAGAIYEGKYLLGTSIARPIQAKCQVDVAIAEKADAVAHGCTGKGNDQVRFELTYKACGPHLKVIAPWRVWNINSREDAIDYAQKHGIDIGKISKKNIYSRDWNVLHMSHEGGELEDPWNRPPKELFLLSKTPQEAPDAETEITIGIEKGIPVSLNGKKMEAFDLLSELNKIGAENAIGRADLVESRVVGMKSRGVYETPGGTILHQALRDFEMLTIDAETLHYKQRMAVEYADLVYAGKWFSPLRESMEAFMERACRYMSGEIRLVLYKGNVIIAGRKSPYSLYNEELASFGESSYNQADATGFINLYGLATGVTAMVQKGVPDQGGQADQMKEMARFHEK